MRVLKCAIFKLGRRQINRPAWTEISKNESSATDIFALLRSVRNWEERPELLARKTLAST